MDKLNSRDFVCTHFFLPQETISLAEERFADNSGEWKFDNAWQEMLNHATIKVERVFTRLLRLTF